MYPAYGTHNIMRTMWGKHTQITRKQSEYRGKTRCQSKPPILAWFKWGGWDNSTPLWSVVISWGWRPTWGIMTSSNGNIFRVTGHLCGEFTGNQWITRTRASDAELWSFLWSVDLCLNKRLSKRWWGWWFETSSRPSWRHCNGGFWPCRRDLPVS